MKQSAVTLHGIPVNERLLWDYTWDRADYGTERFFKWYLARVLANGTTKDIRMIDITLIRKYLNSLIGIPRAVREFWSWYVNR
jgi:hypothetical protein